AEAVMAKIALPAEAMCLVPAKFEGLLARYYDMAHIYHLNRMVLRSFEPVATDGVVRLGSADVDRLNAFYQQAADPGEAILAFSLSQVANRVFYAAESDGIILAAAGTHVVSALEGVAAVGN